MQNPYYQYLAKEDVSYTDSQIEDMLKTEKDTTLRQYLFDIQTLRGLQFKRSKGMKSAAAYSKKRGKAEAEILATRSEKKELISKLSEEVTNLKEDNRVNDLKYDQRFTPRLYEESLKVFKKINVKDLHFSSVKDMIDHLEENQLIFDNARDFEQLLAGAILRDMGPDDNELIEIRAKLETINAVQYVVSEIKNAILLNPDSFLNGKTYKELTDGVYDRMNTHYKKELRPNAPELGAISPNILKPQKAG